jgi:CheY-like chemotaxis protein
LNSPLTADDGGVSARYDGAVANANLMIVDIFMPHMRGLESIRIFHERAPTVPLIATSGYDLNADVLPPAKPIARSASRR